MSELVSSHIEAARRHTMHPDFRTLVERYLTDPRFGGDHGWRDACINNLLRLNELFHTLTLPTDVRAVVLAGSYSANYPNDPPDIGGKPVYGPFHRRQSGGSDIDLLVLHNHPFAFGRTRKNIQFMHEFERFLEHQATQAGYQNIAQLFHVSSEPASLGYALLPEYARYMVRTGTLIVGQLPMRRYGKERDNPPRNKKSDFDDIIDQMGGGY